MDKQEFRELLWIAQGGQEPVSLELLSEQGGDPEDIAEDEDYLWHSVRRGLKELPSYEWAKKLRGLESSTISVLVWILEEKEVEAAKVAGKNRYRAVYSMARLMRTMRAAAEQEKKFVCISDYIHVLDLRATYGLSTRKIAGILDIDESKIRRWDKRAKRLGVTRHNLDEEKLRQIVKPSRAPP